MRKKKAKIGSLARQYDVLYQRLRARINSRQSRSAYIKATEYLNNP